MAARRRRERDVERDVPRRVFVAKLRRLADRLESGAPFRIQVAGERVLVPASASLQVEHERGASEEEVELQLRWLRSAGSGRRRPR